MSAKLGGGAAFAKARKSWLCLFGSLAACTLRTAPLDDSGASDVSVKVSDEHWEPEFVAGQVWHLKAPAGANVTVLRVDDLPDYGEVIHLRIEGDDIKKPGPLSRCQTNLRHIPITRLALLQSIDLDTAPSIATPVPELVGYGTWLSEFRNGRGGVFTLTVGQIMRVLAPNDISCPTGQRE